MPSKKTKSSNENQSTSTLPELVWKNIWAVADDSRDEMHKQTMAWFALVEGVLQGATSFATNLSNRTNLISEHAIKSADASGRKVVSIATSAGQGLVSSYKKRAFRISVSTRTHAKSVASKASATAQVILAPTKAA